MQILIIKYLPTYLHWQWHQGMPVAKDSVPRRSVVYCCSCSFTQIDPTRALNLLHEAVTIREQAVSHTSSHMVTHGNTWSHMVTNVHIAMCHTATLFTSSRLKPG
jgi:hypothetical protein